MLAGYAGLFTASFLAATLLPGGSEIALGLMIHKSPAQWWLIVLVATVGNTLGALTSYLLGRFLPQAQRHANAITWMRRWGHIALLFSWLPLIGDALCVAAGWLKMNPWLATLSIALGKFGRYLVVAQAVRVALTA